jgi:superfamily II DNA/RNA helicase
LETANFSELGLSSKVSEAVAAAGYTEPTPIQAQAIPVAVTGRDVLGIAQTGTGKTAAFVLPMITRLETGRARARMPRSLILAPTRELAAQVAEAFEKYGVNHKLSLALLIGGVSFDEQNRKIDRGVDVLIATPGRLLDHIQRGKLLLTAVEILVIDEADRMLDMGFIPDIERICKTLPPKRQTLFFSATMPPEIQRLVDTFLKDPVRIEVARPATTAKTITQRFQYCAEGEDWAKREMLREMIRSQDVQNAIIFCNRKRDVAILKKSLSKHGFNAGELHGDMDQSSRTATLDKFRRGEIALLAASDVAARGLDIPEVSHVFNFDVPWAGDDYVHRIGRTGRAGREGYAATIVGPDDLKLIKDIEKVTGEEPVWLGDPPTEEDFAEAGKRRGRRGRGSTSRRASSSSRGDDKAVARPARDESGNRSGSRRRGAKQRPDGTEDATTEQLVVAEAEATDQRSENPQAMQSRRRGAKPADAGAQATTSASSQPAEPRGRRQRRDNGGDRPADGFNEHNIPAFLQRPVRPARATKRDESGANNEKQPEDSPA